jgi:hypothetical protein
MGYLANDGKDDLPSEKRNVSFLMRPGHERIQGELNNRIKLNSFAAKVLDESQVGSRERVPARPGRVKETQYRLREESRSR